MKVLSMMVLAISSQLAYSVVNLDLDMKLKQGEKTEALKSKVVAELDKASVIYIPNTNKSIEVIVSEEIPEEIRDPDLLVGEVVLDMKIFEDTKEGRKVISTSQIKTVFGQEASIEVSDTSEENKTSIKVKPTML